MQTKQILKIIASLVLLLCPACTDSSTALAPVEVAKTAFEATLSGNMDTARPFFCAKMHSAFPSQKDMDALQKELNIHFTFDFSGLQYSLEQETAEKAIVRAFGKIVVKVPEGEESLSYDELIPLQRIKGQWLVCE